MPILRREMPDQTPTSVKPGISTYTPCILHDMLEYPSVAGRMCARLDAGKRMIYRFRHGIIGPLAIFWLLVTVASVVLGAVAWNRFSKTIDASAAGRAASRVH